MNYAEGGSGERPVVLIHGVTLRWQSMAEIITELAESTHMYACDLRGHGRSDWADSGYRVSDYVEDISAFVGAASKVGSVLIGYSLGGLIAFGVAPRLPDLVAGCYRDRSPACAAGFGFRGHRVFRCARLDPLGQ